MEKGLIERGLRSNFIYLNIGSGLSTAGIGPTEDALLLETGDFFLLETGDFILLE